MKRQIFFIHGAESFSKYDDFLHYLKTAPLDPFKEPSKRWTHTLREDLGEAFEVFMPQMPNKQNAKYEEWKIWFERHFEHLHDEIVLMGCSLGAMFLAKYCIENTLPFNVSALILMAAAVEGDDLEEEDCGDFIFPLERARVLAQKAKKVVIMHSRDDFLVPFTHGERLHKAIPGSEFVVFLDKNHFLVEEFPELVEKLQREGEW